MNINSERIKNIKRNKICLRNWFISWEKKNEKKAFYKNFLNYIYIRSYDRYVQTMITFLFWSHTSNEMINLKLIYSLLLLCILLWFVGTKELYYFCCFIFEQNLKINKGWNNRDRLKVYGYFFLKKIIIFGIESYRAHIYKTTTSTKS